MYGNQQYLYPKTPTAVEKLLQYSGFRVELRDGFSSCKMIYNELKKVNFSLDFGILLKKNENWWFAG